VYLGAVGLAMNGRIRDIGQDVSQSSLQTENSRYRSHAPICFLIAFLEKAFIRNLIINCEGKVIPLQARCGPEGW